MSDNLQRIDFLSGGMLDAADFTLAQTYNRDAQSLRCRTLHTWGIAEGLEVAAGADGVSVRVAPGMAVDSRGRQLLLAEAQTVGLAKVQGFTAYLALSCVERKTAWADWPEGCGFTRVIEDAVLEVLPSPPKEDGEKIMLARLDFTPERRLLAPDPSCRRLCALLVGRMEFPTGSDGPGGVGHPAIDVLPDGATLRVASMQSDIFCALTVHGGVAVGGNGGKAALTVSVPRPRTGKGVVSSWGALVVGTGAPDLALLSPGDSIHVTPDTAQAISQELKVSQVLPPQTLAVESPGEPFSNVPYAFSSGRILRIRTAGLKDAFVVSPAGHVGVGGSEDENAALRVAGGSVLLDTGHAIRFRDGDGTLVAGDGTHELSLQETTSTLLVREGGDIAFSIGAEPSADIPPGMVVTAGQRVGIGVAAPASTLTVNGTIAVSGAIIFPDGSRQTTGVVPIPVGTVVDWWRPSASTSWGGDGFQLCDGSTITDPASPLVGQKTPDLRGKFVRGVVSYEDIGTTGGSATHHHDHTMGAHVHAMNHLHTVTGSTGKPEQTAGDRIAGDSVSNADHTHYIETYSGNCNPANTGTVAPTPGGSTTDAPNLPPYMDLLKVMRIK